MLADFCGLKHGDAVRKRTRFDGRRRKLFFSALNFIFLRDDTDDVTRLYQRFQRFYRKSRRARE